MNRIMKFHLHFQSLRLKASINRMLFVKPNCGLLTYHCNVESFLIVNMCILHSRGIGDCLLFLGLPWIFRSISLKTIFFSYLVICELLLWPSKTMLIHSLSDFCYPPIHPLSRLRWHDLAKCLAILASSLFILRLDVGWSCYHDCIVLRNGSVTPRLSVRHGTTAALIQVGWSTPSLN